ncbi:MAG: hypothetical protein J0I06_09270 [Planctomycetes bacterium]|nr:hypothetical protein [Planctomycetota bacterium]
MPNFWKLSMGTHAGGGEFSNLSAVRSWVRQRTVLVWGPTGRKGGSHRTQGELFEQRAKIGDLFYLCHGNQEPGVLLLGRFSGLADTVIVPGGRPNWLGRKFTLIKHSKSKAKYEGVEKWWTPDHNSTFVMIPNRDLEQFESVILNPYFGLNLNELQLK